MSLHSSWYIEHIPLLTWNKRPAAPLAIEPCWVLPLVQQQCYYKGRRYLWRLLGLSLVYKTFCLAIWDILTMYTGIEYFIVDKITKCLFLNVCFIFFIDFPDKKDPDLVCVYFYDLSSFDWIKKKIENTKRICFEREFLSVFIV